MADGTLTSIRGVEVGHWTNETALTGVTVMTFPEPNVAAVEVRGGAPGSRTALLAPGMRVDAIQALVFAGGSAYGLAAADGVVRRLERDGRGHVTPVVRVPIVPAAIIFDLGVGDPSVRPGPEDGAAAYDARSGAPVTMGSVGAGTGASVAIWRGLEHVQRSGLGSAAVTTEGSTVAAALAVLNAAGDVFTLEGEPLTGGGLVPGPPAGLLGAMEQTTLVAIATDAALSRSELSRLIVRSHDALGTCLRPAHTRLDGDIVFAVACGARDGGVEALAEAAYVATARALENAFRLSAKEAQ